MNHPTQNDLLRYMDGEASRETITRMREHLEHCPTCAAEVAGWRRSAQKLRALDFPSVQTGPGRKSRVHMAQLVVQRSIAAAIVLFIGFACGHLFALRSGALEQRVTAEAHEEVRREMQADLLAALEPGREGKSAFQQQLQRAVQDALANSNARFYRQVVTLFRDARERQMSDTLALRRDLETAVSTADSDFRQDDKRINQLASTVSALQQ